MRRPSACGRSSVGHVVSSPLLRALKTAEIVAAASSRNVTVDPGLIELDFGSFEGKSCAS